MRRDVWRSIFDGAKQLGKKLAWALRQMLGYEMDDMLNITGPAREMVREIVWQEKTLSPVRIMMAGGCIGPRLAMLLDSERPEDQVFEVEGIQYVISKELLFRFQPITVDYKADSSGGKFSITSPKDDSDS